MRLHTPHKAQPSRITVNTFCSLLAAVAASNTPFLFSVEASTDKRKEEELSPPVQAGGLKGFLFFLKGEAALRKNKRRPLVVSMIFPLGLGAQRKNKDRRKEMTLRVTTGKPKRMNPKSGQNR